MRAGQTAAARWTCLLLLFVLVTALLPTAAWAQGGTTYVVQPGDSLGYIAATYGTTTDAIMQANGLNSADMIYVGQSLTIPVQGAASSGGTDAPGTYTVRLGDSLRSIANALGVTAPALAQANGLTNPDLLYVGQKLLVPGATLGNAAIAPPAAPASAGLYVVQPGDTLNAIAAQLGVSALDLLNANDLTNADLLAVGQKLVIPGATPAASMTPAPSPAPAATAPASAVPPTSTPVPVASTAAPSATPAPTTAAPAVYVVQAGDTLNSIAAALGVSASDLIRANNLDNADMLSIGQQLVIPGAAALTATPLPASTPAATAPAATAQATPVPSGQASATQASAPPAVAAASATPHPTGPIRYTVQPGDTLGGIAQRFDTTAASIARLNRLSSPDLVSVGMNLLVPEPAWTAPEIQGQVSRFVVSISQQHCWLYQGNELVASWVCSTGKPGTDTRPGSYRVQSKMEKAYGSTWNIWMPYWLGIYWAGASEDGIHGIPYNRDTGWKLWEGLVGTPVTYGCVLLDQVHAKQLYDLAYIGMPVIIQP